MKSDGPRIGYFLRTYPRFSQTFIVNEILELERQGLDLCILSQRKPDEGIFHDSVCRVRARAEYLPETLFGNLVKAWRALWTCLRRRPSDFCRAVFAAIRHKDVRLWELVQAGWLVRWARKRRIERLHVHFGTSEATVAWLGRLMGGPRYSLTLHAFDIFRNNVDRRLLAEKINASRFTVTVCESNRRYMIENLPGVNGERIRVNYNGIDLERFRQNGETRETLSIFSVGRLIEKKGFIHLIRAVARLRDLGINVNCSIAGQGPEQQNLREEIERRKLNDRVTLLGPLRQQQVRARMQRAGCLVLPCARARDGNVDALPTVLLEAMACGCPVVSTRISGVPEIIEDGVSGRVVEPGDATALAEAISQIVVDREVAERLGRGGRERAERRFDVRRNVALLRDWLQDKDTKRRAPPHKIAAAPSKQPIARAC
jgi:glycosyltransferase involved in cell wall biosynthesis